MNNSRDEFTEAELFMRERSELPPYGRLANITVTDTSEERLVNFNNYLKSLIPKSDRIKVFGPAPAPITKIRNRYRYKFLIKANKTLDIQKFIENWISGIKKPNSIRTLGIFVLLITQNGLCLTPLSPLLTLFLNSS